MVCLLGAFAVMHKLRRLFWGIPLCPILNILWKCWKVHIRILIPVSVENSFFERQLLNWKTDYVPHLTVCRIFMIRFRLFFQTYGMDILGCPVPLHRGNRCSECYRYVWRWYPRDLLWTVCLKHTVTCWEAGCSRSKVIPCRLCWLVLHNWEHVRIFMTAIPLYATKYCTKNSCTSSFRDRKIRCVWLCCHLIIVRSRLLCRWSLQRRLMPT